MSKEIEAISKVGGIGKKALESIRQKPTVEANKDHFDKLMSQKTDQHTQATQTQQIDPATKSSLVDQVRELHNKSDGWKLRIENDDLVAQAQDAVKQIEAIKGQLETPDLNIKAPVQRLLTNKLKHVNENLQIALNKAGLEYKDLGVPNIQSSNPIERFFGLLTDGQRKLDTLSSNLSMMKEDEISPTKMLAIQIKVNFAQQEIELFSSLLNKTLESVKTTMNVQV